MSGFMIFFRFVSFPSKIILKFLKLTGTPNNTGLEMLMNMFGGLGAGSLSAPNQPDGYFHFSFLSLFYVILLHVSFSSLLKILFLF